MFCCQLGFYGYLGKVLKLFYQINSIQVLGYDSRELMILKKLSYYGKSLTIVSRSKHAIPTTVGCFTVNVPSSSFCFGTVSGITTWLINCQRLLCTCSYLRSDLTTLGITRRVPPFCVAFAKPGTFKPDYGEANYKTARLMKNTGGRYEARGGLQADNPTAQGIDAYLRGRMSPTLRTHVTDPITQATPEYVNAVKGGMDPFFTIRKFLRSGDYAEGMSGISRLSRKYGNTVDDRILLFKANQLGDDGPSEHTRATKGEIRQRCTTHRQLRKWNVTTSGMRAQFKDEFLSFFSDIRFINAEMCKVAEEWEKHPSWDTVNDERNMMRAFGGDFVTSLRHVASRREQGKSPSYLEPFDMGRGWFALDDVMTLFMIRHRGECHYTAFSLFYMIMANMKGRIQLAIVFDEDVKDIQVSEPGVKQVNRGWCQFNTDCCTLYVRVVHGGSAGRSAEYCGGTLLTPENFDYESQKFEEKTGQSLDDTYPVHACDVKDIKNIDRTGVLDASLSRKHQQGKTREDQMFGTRMPADAGLEVSGIRADKPIWLTFQKGRLRGMVRERYSLTIAPNFSLNVNGAIPLRDNLLAIDIEENNFWQPGPRHKRRPLYGPYQRMRDNEVARREAAARGEVFMTQGANVIRLDDIGYWKARGQADYGDEFAYVKEMRPGEQIVKAEDPTTDPPPTDRLKPYWIDLGKKEYGDEQHYLKEVNMQMRAAIWLSMEPSEKPITDDEKARRELGLLDHRDELYYIPDKHFDDWLLAKFYRERPIGEHFEEDIAAEITTIAAAMSQTRRWIKFQNERTQLLYPNTGQEKDAWGRKSNYQQRLIHTPSPAFIDQVAMWTTRTEIVHCILGYRTKHNTLQPELSKDPNLLNNIMVDLSNNKFHELEYLKKVEKEHGFQKINQFPVEPARKENDREVILIWELMFNYYGAWLPLEEIIINNKHRITALLLVTLSTLYDPATGTLRENCFINREESSNSRDKHNKGRTALAVTKPDPPRIVDNGVEVQAAEPAPSKEVQLERMLVKIEKRRDEIEAGIHRGVFQEADSPTHPEIQTGERVYYNPATQGLIKGVRQKPPLKQDLTIKPKTPQPTPPSTPPPSPRDKKEPRKPTTVGKQQSKDHTPPPSPRGPAEARAVLSKAAVATKSSPPSSPPLVLKGKDPLSEVTDEIFEGSGSSATASGSRNRTPTPPPFAPPKAKPKRSASEVTPSPRTSEGERDPMDDFHRGRPIVQSRAQEEKPTTAAPMAGPPPRRGRYASEPRRSGRSREQDYDYPLRTRDSNDDDSPSKRQRSDEQPTRERSTGRWRRHLSEPPDARPQRREASRDAKREFARWGPTASEALTARAIPSEQCLIDNFNFRAIEGLTTDQRKFIEESLKNIAQEMQKQGQAPSSASSSSNPTTEGVKDLSSSATTPTRQGKVIIEEKNNEALAVLAEKERAAIEFANRDKEAFRADCFALRRRILLRKTKEDEKKRIRIDERQNSLRTYDPTDAPTQQDEMATTPTAQQLEDQKNEEMIQYLEGLEQRAKDLRATTVKPPPLYYKEPFIIDDRAIAGSTTLDDYDTKTKNRMEAQKTMQEITQKIRAARTKVHSLDVQQAEGDMNIPLEERGLRRDRHGIQNKDDASGNPRWIRSNSPTASRRSARRAYKVTPRTIDEELETLQLAEDAITAYVASGSDRVGSPMSTREISTVRGALQTRIQSCLLRKGDAALASRGEETLPNYNNEEPSKHAALEKLAASFADKPADREQLMADIVKIEWSPDGIDVHSTNNLKIQEMQREYNNVRAKLEYLQDQTCIHYTYGEELELVKLQERKRDFDITSCRWMLNFMRAMGRYTSVDFKWVLQMLDDEWQEPDNEEEMYQQYSAAKKVLYALCFEADVLDANLQPIKSGHEGCAVSEKCRSDAIIWKIEQRFPHFWCRYRSTNGMPYPLWYVTNTSTTSQPTTVEEAQRRTSMTWEQAFEKPEDLKNRNPWGLDPPVPQYDSGHMEKWKNVNDLTVKEIMGCPVAVQGRNWKPGGFSKNVEAIPPDIYHYTQEPFLQELQQQFMFMNHAPWKEMCNVLLFYTEEIMDPTLRDNPSLMMSPEALQDFRDTYNGARPNRISRQCLHRLDSLQEITMYFRAWYTEDPKVRDIIHNVHKWPGPRNGCCSVKQPDGWLVDYLCTAILVACFGMKPKVKYQKVGNAWYKYFLIAFLWKAFDLPTDDLWISMERAGDIMESLLSRAFCQKRFAFVLSVLRVYCCWLMLPAGWQEDDKVNFLGPRGDFSSEVKPDINLWPAGFAWSTMILPVPTTGDAATTVETSRVELQRVTYSFPQDPDQELQPQDENAYNENSSLVLTRAATSKNPEVREKYAATVRGRKRFWVAKEPTTVDKADEILEGIQKDLRQEVTLESLPPPTVLDLVVVILENLPGVDTGMADYIVSQYSDLRDEMVTRIEAKSSLYKHLMSAADRYDKMVTRNYDQAKVITRTERSQQDFTPTMQGTEVDWAATLVNMKKSSMLDWLDCMVTVIDFRGVHLADAVKTLEKFCIDDKGHNANIVLVSHIPLSKLGQEGITTLKTTFLMATQKRKLVYDGNNQVLLLFVPDADDNFYDKTEISMMETERAEGGSLCAANFATNPTVRGWQINFPYQLVEVKETSDSSRYIGGTVKEKTHIGFESQAHCLSLLKENDCAIRGDIDLPAFDYEGTAYDPYLMLGFSQLKIVSASFSLESHANTKYDDRKETSVLTETAPNRNAMYDDVIRKEAVDDHKKLFKACIEAKVLFFTTDAHELLTRTPYGMNRGWDDTTTTFELPASLLVKSLADECMNYNHKRNQAIRVGFTPISHYATESVYASNWHAEEESERKKNPKPERKNDIVNVEDFTTQYPSCLVVMSTALTTTSCVARAKTIETLGRLSQVEGVEDDYVKLNKKTDKLFLSAPQEGYLDDLAQNDAYAADALCELVKDKAMYEETIDESKTYKVSAYLPADWRVKFITSVIKTTPKEFLAEGVKPPEVWIPLLCIRLTDIATVNSRARSVNKELEHFQKQQAKKAGWAVEKQEKKMKVKDEQDEAPWSEETGRRWVTKQERHDDTSSWWSSSRGSGWASSAWASSSASTATPSSYRGRPQREGSWKKKPHQPRQPPPGLGQPERSRSRQPR